MNAIRSTTLKLATCTATIEPNVLLLRNYSKRHCGLLWRIRPLTGGGKVTCELRRMFLLPQTRAIGLGRRLLTMFLNKARKCGYKKHCIETLDRMWRANELYKKNGFKLLDSPQGKTGHCRCDRWYLLNL
ncbi:GNAT family N-acetyltransferase [Rhodopirellula sp.]|nr:GNAT family N-acetyltransferase [Rhodopirellula sp.]